MFKREHGEIFLPSFKGALETIRSNSFGTEKGRKAAKFVNKAINDFFNAPRDLCLDIRSKAVGVQVQAFTQTADIPNVKELFESFVAFENYDFGYEPAFRTRTFEDTSDRFSIVNITSAFTFDELPEPGSLTIKKFTGTSIDVIAKYYGDAVGWDFRLLENRKFGEMVEVAREFVNAWYAKKVNLYYRLLTDSSYDTVNGNASIAWAGAGTDPQIVRDRMTLSAMKNAIGSATQDLGLVPNVATAKYIVYGQPTHEGRILAALNSMYGVANGIGSIVTGDVTYVPTYNLSRTGASVGANDIIMVMAQGKIQKGDKILPQTYTTEDYLSFSTVQSVRAAVAGVVAEPKQTIKGALA